MITLAVRFPMLSKGCGADYICMPKPIHNPDGSESLWCYTKPIELYGDLRDAHGHFPLKHFWGPLANIQSTAWIADDRRTASAWFVAGGVQDDWDRFYDCLISVGRISEKLATIVLGLVVHKFAPGLAGRITVGLDNSPTPRYGKHVEGAGVHRNPTPGPADGEWLYGHRPPRRGGARVALGWLAIHPAWGVIALPLRSRMYVREIDVPKLVEKYDWEFRTKHQLGVELLTWFISTLRKRGVKTTVWLVVDGAYAARPFLLPILELGIVIISRLRKDACLFDLPAEDVHGNRIYGKNKISLAKRAGHCQGWSTITYHCRGVEVTRSYKTFLATSRLISGRAPTQSVGRRVVIVRFEDGGWAPYFCTDTSAEASDILETVAARWAIEAFAEARCTASPTATPPSPLLIQSRHAT